MDFVFELILFYLESLEILSRFYVQINSNIRAVASTGVLNKSCCVELTITIAK